ncbi:hypothetical protein [Noviherbaspirillum massiliense]|uniref:hypothetical protein n=1 Tax=Noviherbaspirillum massiliense TaxID=1465823 RepID=UPI0002FDE7C2|nr:hypothetical protein [Noviherbaspirillum massiliense]
MIIKKILAGVLGLIGMAVAIIPAEACDDGCVTKKTGKQKYVEASTGANGANASASQSSRIASSDTTSGEEEQLTRQSLTELRHFAAYARYRALTSTSSGATAVDDDVTSPKADPAPGDRMDSSGAAETFACPDPRHGN